MLSDISAVKGFLHILFLSPRTFRSYILPCDNLFMLTCFLSSLGFHSNMELSSGYKLA
jgi:hypothetical protein